ncbi:MAG: phytanoyl-CoA dioxygenase family protein [Flavobacteriales bacterium]
MKTLFYLGIYLPSLLIYLITKKTPKYMYIAQRRLFMSTGGKFNDVISSIISKIRGKYDISNSKGILGDLSQEDAKKISNEIEENGFYIFDTKISDEFIEKVTHFSSVTPSKIIDINKKHVQVTTDEFIIDRDNILSPKYSFDGSRLVSNETIQDLVFDENLLHIAQEYLGTKPIFDSIALWFSAPFNNEGTSAAAQEFHFDMDRIKFLKFFVYLSDVGTENGPHCYVPKSHKTPLPKEFRKDGRVPDERIEEYYGKPLEICKPKGSIMLVDTRGFHKGKPLTSGERLLLQMEYTNSLLGQKTPSFKAKKITNIEKYKKYKRTFQLIKIDD